MKTKGIEIPPFFFPEGKILEIETIEEQNVNLLFFFYCLKIFFRN